MSDTPFFRLLVVVFDSILEVFILCLAGYILATRGILDKTTQKQINRLNVSLFTPCLLFSKVAFFLSPAKLRELWIIPIFFILVTLVSMTVAWALATLCGLRRSQRSFAMAAAMFMNSNSLPIALMQSLVVTVPNLKWDSSDSVNAMLGRALTYLVLYSTLGMVLRWSYGVRLLARADSVMVPSTPGLDSEHTPLLEPPSPPSPTRRMPHHEPSVTSTTQVSLPDSPLSAEFPHFQDPNYLAANTATNMPKRPQMPYRGRSNVFLSFPNTPNPSLTKLPPYTTTITTAPPSSSAPTSEEDDDDDITPTTILPRPPRPHVHSARHLTHKLTNFLSALSEFMTPPLYSALLSLVVACIQPLQHILSVHLSPVRSALGMAGNCSIPLTLVVLGAYFYVPPPKEEGEERRRERSLRVDDGRTGRTRQWFRSLFNKPSHRRSPTLENGQTRLSPTITLAKTRTPSTQPGETKTVAIAILSRMIITPLLILPLMSLMKRWSVQDVLDDPVFVVANVLLISSPPALTLAQITQAASGDAFERLISRTIFWAYCVVTPPATMVYVVVGLLLCRLD